jgi:DNA-directed RNA polymerase specialized sigma24 family protein
LRLPTGAYIDEGNMANPNAALAEDELLLAERHAALCEAFSDLPPGYRQLVALLIADPPLSYTEISARLGIPIGSIGPSRNRCLARLRRHPAIAMLVDADAGLIGSEEAS